MDFRTDRIERQPLTKFSSNKGFIGNSSFLPRLNFGVSGHESSLQSITVYSLERRHTPIE